jgi:hypothetical protein
MNRASIFSAIVASAIAALGLALSPSNSVVAQSPDFPSILPPALDNPKDARPEAAAALFPPASTLAFWRNRRFNYFYKTTTGNQYTQSAELDTNHALGFELFVFSGQSYGGTSCERSVLNEFHGTLELFTKPQLSIKLPGTGVQTWTDTCDPALDHKVPLSGFWAWIVYPLDRHGSRFEFQNSNYANDGFIADFIFTKIK